MASMFGADGSGVSSDVMIAEAPGEWWWTWKVYYCGKHVGQVATRTKDAEEALLLSVDAYPDGMAAIRR